MDINNVVLIGRATKDPVMSYTTSQTAVAKFNLAVQRYPVGADFPSIVAFGKLAETIEKYVHKGDKIGIVGKVQTSSYESEGKKVYTTNIVADKMEFLNSKSDNAPSESDNPSDGFEKLIEDIPFED